MHGLLQARVAVLASIFNWYYSMTCLMECYAAQGNNVFDDVLMVAQQPPLAANSRATSASPMQEGLHCCMRLA